MNRSIFSLLVGLILLLSACSSGSDLSRTTFQKKRYSRGYYVHTSGDRKSQPAPPTTAFDCEKADISDASEPMLRLVDPASIPASPSLSTPAPTSSKSASKRGTELGKLITLPPMPAVGLSFQTPDTLMRHTDALHAPPVKRPLHWSIWVASGAFVLGLIPSLHVLLFTAWIPAYLGIVASGPNKEHSGLALATVLFIASLLLGLLALGVIAVFLRYVFGG